MDLPDNKPEKEPDNPAPPSDAGMIVLPDGTKPIPLGSGIITGILGQGGMAVVYEIWNEKLGVKRAIKLLRPNSSPENKDRFFTEVKLTAQLDHPNIIDVHAVGEWNGLPYIEMEMVDGFSLDTLIRDKGPLPLEICTSISIFICRALNYTHRHEFVINNQPYIGLLHRDLKPANTLISKKGIVRLSDFGIAVPTSVNPHPTTGGKVVGSMQYLAPEQLLEDEIDHRADIFSFGCILYEMLTGEKTFPERNITRLVQKRLRNEFAPLSSFNLSIPPKLVQVVNHCLQQNTLKRPQDVKMILDELETVHAKLTSKTPEECISFYINGNQAQKDLVFLRTKPPIIYKVAIISIVVLSILSLSILFVLRFNSNADKTNEYAAFDSTLVRETIKPAEENNRAVTTNGSITKVFTREIPPQDSPRFKETDSIAIPLHDPRKKQTPTTVILTDTVPKRRELKPPVDTGKGKPVQLAAVTPVPKPSGPNEINASATPGIEKLVKQNNVSNPLELLRKYNAQNDFDSVLNTYPLLPQRYSKSTEAKLYRHRAIVGTNKDNKSYYENTANNINDAEFYVSKAQYYYEHKNYQQASWTLQLIRLTPAQLMNIKELQKKALYLNAECQTALFNREPTPEKNKIAMQSWFEVKNEFRDNQEHTYFKEANKQIRLLSRHNK